MFLSLWKLPQNATRRQNRLFESFLSLILIPSPPKNLSLPFQPPPTTHFSHSSSFLPPSPLLQLLDKEKLRKRFEKQGQPQQRPKRKPLSHGTQISRLLVCRYASLASTNFCCRRLSMQKKGKRKKGFGGWWLEVGRVVKGGLLYEEAFYGLRWCWLFAGV